jgi:hypothetical protein
MKDHFNEKPKIVMVDEQLVQVAKYKSWLDLGGKDGGIGDPSKEVKH